MDIQAVLGQPPFSLLEADVKGYALDALAGDCTLEDAAEVLGPFLVDANLVSDEYEVVELLQNFGVGKASSAHAAGAAPTASQPSLAAPVSMAALCASQANGKSKSQPVEPGEKKAAAQRARGKGEARLSAARQAAHASEALRRALTPGCALELKGGDTGEDATATLARALRAEWPNLAEGGSADFLAASFFAYSAEKLSEGQLGRWSQVLQEVLQDASCLDAAEEADVAAGATRVVTQLVKKGVLQAKAWAPDPGDQVLAVLPEDEEWHLAVVDRISEDTLHIVFVEYGKPMDVAVADVRCIDDVLDEGSGDLEEGECEMCGRLTMLTFHHLIPKDVHPTYLGKRLPRGVEGEPTRAFLNSYGLMICRPCHNTVHKIADNGVLAVEYNTLAKVMEHPSVQRWVEYAKRLRLTKRSGR